MDQVTEVRSLMRKKPIQQVFEAVGHCRGKPLSRPNPRRKHEPANFCPTPEY